MIFLLDRNQTISHTVNKSEIHPALSEIAKFISLSIFCHIFGILVCNLVMNHCDQERLFMVKVLTAFLFSLLIFVFTIHKFS